jgi:hypothetical protein
MFMCNYEFFIKKIITEFGNDLKILLSLKNITLKNKSVILRYFNR